MVENGAGFEGILQWLWRNSLTGRMLSKQLVASFMCWPVSFLLVNCLFSFACGRRTDKSRITCHADFSQAGHENNWSKCLQAQGQLRHNLSGILSFSSIWSHHREPIHFLNQFPEIILFLFFLYQWQKYPSSQWTLIKNGTTITLSRTKQSISNNLMTQTNKYRLHK